MNKPEEALLIETVLGLGGGTDRRVCEQMDKIQMKIGAQKKRDLSLRVTLCCQGSPGGVRVILEVPLPETHRLRRLVRLVWSGRLGRDEEMECRYPWCRFLFGYLCTPGSARCITHRGSSGMIN